MSRRHRAEKREINPDPKFGDLVVSKFMNNLMYEGKKSVAIEVQIQPVERTLTDEDFEALTQKIVASVTKVTGGVLRG